MEKVYSLQNLDCANCAAKIEAKFNALPQVDSAVIVFATRQLRLSAEDPDALLPQLETLGRTVEADFAIAPFHDVHNHDHQACCSCGHDHHHDHGHEHNQLPRILLGAGLFLLGLVLTGCKVPVAPAISFISAYLVLGLPVLIHAGKNLVKGHFFDENFLMSIATLGAFAIGEFPEAVGIMLFYQFGEWFEGMAVSRSRSQILEAIDLRPEVVTLANGETVPAEAAQVGDLLQIRPGDRIPLDGIIVSGSSRLDTAPVTGESVPVSAEPGNRVFSGCVNLEGLLTLRVEKPLSESLVSRILSSVEHAAANKPRIDRFITRFARVYTPIVIALATATALIPGLITGNWGYWVYTALSFLVMSCPCALVLSVPLAFFSGIGAGSKQGILFKGGLSMEAMANIKALVLDKTGTLTRGDFTVQQADDTLLSLCAGCEQHSTHPIARSIVAAAKERNLPIPEPETVEEFSGHGICARIGGEHILCGNEKLMEKFQIPLPPLPEETMGSRVLVAKNGSFLGSLTVSDTLKPDAKSAVDRLKKRGITVAIFTGDHASAAKAVGSLLGIDRVHARLLPQEKLEQLCKLRQETGAVMFVGDGMNDAPVLAGADVGGAMGTGADAAIEAADVVYMTGEVSAIANSLELARQTKTIAWQNIIFALGIKAAVMLLGILGHASMWAAVFADSGVAMLCVLNSLRILFRKNGLLRFRK